MSFLQPAILFALPVIALPIIIHLINQRRFQTIRWGAMMFLLAANRMSRGYARIRQWLILAARTLAVAGLILAVSRPLASGILGLAGGGRVDTTIVLLDRSPSMQQRGADGRSKLETARDQLVQSLGMIRSNHWVLIDSATMTPVEIESPAVLAGLPETEGVGATADVAGMLQAASDYIRANRPSRSEVWICSDVRQSDWDSDSGRWPAIREAFLELPQAVRFHLLAYADAAPENRSIRVTGARLSRGTGFQPVSEPSRDGKSEAASGDGAQEQDGAQEKKNDRLEAAPMVNRDASPTELLLSLRIEQASPVEGTVKVPVQLEIDGARSEITAEMTASELEIKDYAIPLDGRQVRGWGRVSIPADSNFADNEAYFVFDRPPPRKTVVVTEDPAAVRPLELAAGIAPNPEIAAATETITPQQVPQVEWKDVALLLWQAPLPSGEAADIVKAFQDRGGDIVFFPPEAPTADEYAGLRWTDWQELPDEAPVSTWVGDSDLLANAKSGAALPVGQLRVSRYCGIEGEHTPLASLQGGSPLLARAVTDQRNVYFCATTTSPDESSLARDGVVLYVLVQRALAAGAATLGTARNLEAGAASPEAAAEWRRLSDLGEALSTTYAWQAGAYEEGEKLLAVNRGELEDKTAVVPEARVAALFDRLDFDRVDQSAGTGASLIQEIWRMFLALMMAALLMESLLCLPRITKRAEGPGVGRGMIPASGAA